MSQHYGALLTALGEAKITAAIAHHSQIQLTHLAVGDGDGQLPPLHSAQTTLVHEQYRVALNSLTIDPDNSSHLIAEAILREEIGGWWIREIGLFDEQGELCAVANCPETYKPKLEEGAGRTQVIRLVLVVSSATAVALTPDPAVALATRQEVNHQIEVLSNQIQTLKDELKKAGIGTTLRTFEGDMEQNLAPGEYYVSSQQLKFYYFKTSLVSFGGILKVFKIGEKECCQLLITDYGMYYRYHQSDLDRPKNSGLGYNHSWRSLMTDQDTSVGEILFKLSTDYTPAYVADNNWLACNGELVHRKSFQSLFDAIWTQYGSDEEEKHFRLPKIAPITLKDQQGKEITLYPYIGTGKIYNGFSVSHNIDNYYWCLDNSCVPDSASQDLEQAREQVEQFIDQPPHII